MRARTPKTLPASSRWQLRRVKAWREHGERLAAHIAALRDELQNVAFLLKSPIPGVNGTAPRVPGTLNVSFGGHSIRASLVELLDERGVCAAGGSACSSHEGEPSHVLVAMGLPSERTQSALRFSLSNETTQDDIDYTVGVLKACSEQLQPFALLDLSSF